MLNQMLLLAANGAQKGADNAAETGTSPAVWIVFGIVVLAAPHITVAIRRRPMSIHPGAGKSVSREASESGES